MMYPVLNLHPDTAVLLLLPQLSGTASGKGAGWALQHLTLPQLCEPEARTQPRDTSFLFLQLDLGIPAMTKCCNQLDICYDTCGANKYRCDAKFRWCLHSICSDLKRSLGFVSKVQGRLPTSHSLCREAWGEGVGKKKQNSAVGSSTSVLHLSQVGHRWVRTQRSALSATHFCPKAGDLWLFAFRKLYNV